MQKIQISRKIVISSPEEAKPYQLELLYDSYFKELDFQLDCRGVNPGVTIPFPIQFEINEILNTTYVRQFESILNRVKPFVDLSEIPLDIESVKLACRTFTRNASRQVLFIFLESKPMAVVDSYGSTKVLKNPSTADGNPLLSVELDKSTVIVALKD